jgi:hypothetical protein
MTGVVFALPAGHSGRVAVDDSVSKRLLHHAHQNGGLVFRAVRRRSVSRPEAIPIAATDQRCCSGKGSNGYLAQISWDACSG